ncbi:hypothetical protein [Thioclava sp. SK-1]|nr:hypothetical protein [Thioclava sp. SK-1]
MKRTFAAAVILALWASASLAFDVDMPRLEFGALAPSVVQTAGAAQSCGD